MLAEIVRGALQEALRQLAQVTGRAVADDHGVRLSRVVVEVEHGDVGCWVQLSS